jgi:hypothetical protein
MAADGLQGVASHWLFDDYWPGSTETSLWKNMISFLTEAASCRTATPVFVEPTELQVRGKGLAEYKKGVNMPAPWPGGVWGLGDIVEYELSSMNSILATASRHRAEILQFRNDICRKEVEKGLTEPPYYFVLPRDQRDPGELYALVRLLDRHGVQVMNLNQDIVVGEHHLSTGDVVVPLAQPYRAFVKEMLETQRYPERHYTPKGELIRPYDITSWSLPLHMGVRAIQVDTRSSALEAALDPISQKDATPRFAVEEGVTAMAFLPSENQSYRATFAALGQGLTVGRLTESLQREEELDLPAGTFVVSTRGSSGDALQGFLDAIDSPPIALRGAIDGNVVPISLPRVALVETWFHDMDAGWTRYLFDTYGIEYRVLHPEDFEAADLAADFDVIVFPDESKDVLTKGKYKRGDRYVTNDYPPKFRKPISKAGMGKISAFIEGGGTVVSWGGSTALFTDGLASPTDEKDADKIELPVRDITQRLEGVSAPGSFLAVDFISDHPLTWGMPERGGAFTRGRPVFATSIPRLDTDRRVIAVYPERDLLLSGYLAGEKELQNRPAMVWVRAGKGQIVLFGIRPQFRGSVPATFKLVFNALLLPPVNGGASD